MIAEATSGTSGFFPVPLAIMRPGTLAPVNLYVRIRPPAEFTLYKTGRSRLSDETRQRLIERGVSYLYVRKEDEDAYYAYVEDHIADILKDGLLPTEDAWQIVYRTSSRVMEDVFENPRSGRNIRRAHKMAEAAVYSVLNDRAALWCMTAVASHDYSTYTHCVNVCIFLVSACRDVLDISETAVLNRVGLGGMLHDIGKSAIPEEILTKPGKLTPQEFEQIKEHPALGLDIVKCYMDVPRLAAQVILSHHEHFDGTGYPRGLAGERIARVVRLATIIDVYDALTTERPSAAAMASYDALALMLAGMTGYFDVPMLRSFVEFLGPQDARTEPAAHRDASVV